MNTILIFSENPQRNEEFRTFVESCNQYTTDLSYVLVNDELDFLNCIQNPSSYHFCVIISAMPKGILLAKKFRNALHTLHIPLILIAPDFTYLFEALNVCHCYGYLSYTSSKKEYENTFRDLFLYCLGTAPVISFYDINRVFHQLELSQIIYAEVQNHILHIVTPRHQYKTRAYTLKSFYEYFGTFFKRCSRKHLVNTNYIQSYDKCALVITLTHCNKSIKIGRAYANDLKNLM